MIINTKIKNNTITVLGIYVNDMTFVAQDLPKGGQTIIGHRFYSSPGGKGTNQAIAAKRAGGKVNFISRIGNDDFGKSAIKFFKKEKINIKNITIDKNQSSGVAGIFLDKNAENKIIVFPGASSNITFENIDSAEETINSSDVFITQLEIPIKIVEYSLKLAKKSNIITILNPAPAIKLEPSLFKLIDILTPNQIEASFITGINIKTIEEAKKAGQILIGFGIKYVIITLGKRGAIVCEKNKSYHLESIKIGNAIDTTGAGDAFNGALAAAIANGKDIIDSASFANNVAALSVTKMGASSGMPKQDEINIALKNRD